MPLGNFTWKNIGVTVHIIAPWSLLGPKKGGLNDKNGHGAKIWTVTPNFFPVKLPRDMSSKWKKTNFHPNWILKFLWLAYRLKVDHDSLSGKKWGYSKILFEPTCICFILHFILDKTIQEKYELPVQRKIPLYLHCLPISVTRVCIKCSTVP